MISHFMLSDLIGTFEALLLFPLILLVPGYVLGWLLDILAFRRRTLLTRLTLAVPLSIGICPIVTYLLWRFLPPAVWVFYAACAIVFVVLFFRERREFFSQTAASVFFKRGSIGLAIVGAWVVMATLALVDLQLGHRLYFPTVTYDYALRTAFTAAICRTGVPPHNPFFFAGGFFPLRYHYFWFILCAAAEKLTGPSVSPRLAMIAGTVWCGIGLLALVPLYLRFFQDKGKAGIDRRAWIGIALLGVTGLDLAPVLFMEWVSHRFMGSIEWWNDPVTAWVHAVMWVPHHVAGLIACLTGFLVVWDGARLPSPRRRMVVGAAAGAMFASALGLTIYVTLVFAVFLFVWMTMEFLRSHRRQAGVICLSGVLASVLAAPYLTELLPAGSSAVAASGSPLQFAIRPFDFVDRLFGLAGGPQTNLVNALLLPVNYSLELGFFLIAGVVACGAMWRNRRFVTDAQWCGLTMAAVSLAICSFVRSSVIGNNDLGWRGILVAQFVLLIWAAELLNDGLLSSHSPVQSGRESHLLTGKWRALAAVALVLGAAGSVYEVVKVRLFPLASDMGAAGTVPWLSPDTNLGARTFALRQLYEGLKQRTPAASVFQHNPNTNPEDLFHGSYADRQLAAEGPACGVVLGGNAALCRNMIGDIDSLFTNPASLDSTRVDEICGRLSIDMLVVKDTDPVWRDRQSWVWKRKPILENDYARAFACSPPAEDR
jgi:hypothetical protein